MKESTYKSFYHLLFDQARFGIMNITFSGDIIDLNPFTCNLLGYKRDELSGRSVYNLLHPDDAGLDLLIMGPTEKELRILKKNGDYITVEMHGYKLEPDGFVILIHDISLRKQALLSSEEKYRQIAEYTSDVIWMMNDQMHYTYISPSIYKQRGFTPEEFLKLRPDEIYTAESLMKVIEIYRNSMAWAREGKIPVDYTMTVELKHYCKDGSVRDSEVLISPVFDTCGMLFGGHGVSRDITDRKKSEKALKESEDKFRGFFENAPIGLWEEDLSEVRQTMEEWKQAGIDVHKHLNENPEMVKHLAALVRVTALNRTSLEIVGEPDKESVVKNLPYYFNDDSYLVFKNEMIALAEGHSTYTVEIPVYKSGNLRTLNLSLAIQPGYETNWERVLVSFIDITQRKQSELNIALLADFQSKLLKINVLNEIHDLVTCSVQNLIGDGIILTTNIDPNTGSGRIVSISELEIPGNGLTQALGFDPLEMNFFLKDISGEELLLYKSGKLEILPGGLFTLATDRFPEETMRGIEKQLRIKYIYSVGFVYQELHLGGLIILARKDLSEYSDIIEMIASQAAISINRIKAVATLKEVEERFRLAFLTSPDSININNLETGMYIEVNEGFCVMTGYRKEEVVGRTSHEINIWANIADRKKMVEILKQDGKVQNFEAAFRIKDGTMRTCLMSASVIHLYGAPHIISITRDIEKLKQAERDILNAKEAAEEASRLKTAFLNNISHEVRTPMNAILGFTELLQSEENTADDRDRYVGIVQTNAKQLLSIIDDVLEISRMDSGRIPINSVQFSLNDLMDEIQLSLNDMVVRKGLHLWHSVDDCGISDFVVADLEKIRQVITGLINNAVKFTHSGSISFGCFKKENELVFYVRDTGIGIAHDVREKIFERFYQVTQEPGAGVHGTGLGLSIARGLAEMMNGTIRVESTSGAGSVFILTIPYEQPHFPKETSENVMPYSLEVLTILVAEDEDYNFELLEILLGRKTRQLIRASNGVEVLAILEKQKPDLVLMDLKMPVMDGYEATRRAKAIFPNLRIIALTAYTQPEDERRAMEAGCCAFVCKPIKKQELFETIRRSMRK
ncbi:MAG: PAS domain S-box protein [Bacteroidetes bacterium]|nr:PAS domain S-box protein [Bacteroidota bacterium]